MDVSHGCLLRSGNLYERKTAEPTIDLPWHGQVSELKYCPFGEMIRGHNFAIQTFIDGRAARDYADWMPHN
jgi:hypothetical protein